MPVILTEVTEANWLACANLELSDKDQKFVTPNVFTLAGLNFEPHWRLRAIYAGDSLVGMLAYCRDDEDGIEHLYWLFRLMIATPFQGKGYGKAAVRAAIAEMKGHGAREIRTMHWPENTRASKLYKKIGFEVIGEQEDGDILLRLSGG